jgi:2,4-dienoyl-CoA reductase (NADPH2)
MGCYELDRFDGDWQRMVDALMWIYDTKPALRIPDPPADRSAAE